MEIVIIWVILAIITAVYANSQGRDGGRWFVLSILLTPVLCFILVLVMPNISEQTALQDGTLKVCPFCAEHIKPTAKICKHCSKELPV